MFLLTVNPRGGRGMKTWDHSKCGHTINSAITFPKYGQQAIQIISFNSSRQAVAWKRYSQTK